MKSSTHVSALGVAVVAAQKLMLLLLLLRDVTELGCW